MTIQANYLDVTREYKKLGEEDWELTKQIREIKARRQQLKRVIEKNDEGSQDWIVEVPASALPIRAKSERVNWKELVMEMFEKYQVPMSTEMMCNKLWFHYPQVDFDRRGTLLNVSAALSSLTSRDQKLARVKHKDVKSFVYGFRHFFGFNLQLKLQYYEQWLREEGKAEAEIEVIVNKIKEEQAKRKTEVME